MKNRKTVTIDLTQIEAQMIVDALKRYANDPQYEIPFPEYEKLAEEIQKIESSFNG